MKLSLVVMTPGPNQGKVLEIKLSQFVIGRDQQCQLRPASPMISKRHCALIQREGKAFLRDFDSTNGTFLNNNPVKGEVELHDGDQLKIGPLLFKVALEAATPVNRPTPPPPTKAAAPTTRPVKAAAPAPAATNGASTPVPATAAAEAAAAPKPPSEPSHDDDIAAMLLSLQDDGAAGINSGTAIVPEGSTIHDMPLPPEVAAQMGQEEKDKAPPPKPSSPANTSQAAKSILEKYMRRPRGG